MTLITEAKALLSCYRAVSISLPVVERSRILAAIASAWSIEANLPVYLWNLGLSGWCKVSLNDDRNLKIESVPTWSLPGHSEPLSLASAALSTAMNESQNGLFVVENLPSLLALEGALSQSVRAVLVNLVYQLAAESEKFLILLDSNETALPASLSGIVPQWQLPLPDRAQLKTAIATELASVPQDINLPLDELAHIALGLGEQETRLGIRTSLAKQGQSQCSSDSWSELLLEYKINRFRAMGLNFVPRPEIATFAGMNRLKQGIERIACEFQATARDYNIPLPKGWLLVGPPGTGKSLAVKVTAAQLGFPLVNAEIGAILNGGAVYLENLIRRIEAAAPVVLWLDEFDKFFTPSSHHHHEVGNSAQILGVLLNWLQEKRSQVFVMAALNRLSTLPPELTRSGRFDKIFYVDFPQAYERKAIFELHLSQYDNRYSHTTSPLTEKEWHRLLNATVKCSGAEIFDIVKNAAIAQYHGAAEKHQFIYRLGLDELLKQRELMTPLYVRDTDRILVMENQAKFVAEPVSSPDPSVFARSPQTLWGEAL